MADLNVAIKIAAQDNASGPLGRIQAALGGLDGAAQKGLGHLRAMGTFLGGAALAGVGALGAGFMAAGAAGLGFNNQMEQVRARLNAFTKDGKQTEQILDMIQQRAANTPFAFNEMADAAAGLLPAAKASGVGLETLIEKAEILAASNPSEGLTGAAFALREAASGDFTSIIERFNLSRQAINQLKEQGVPALEIVSLAMEQMGLDASLVTNLGQTLTGRWSTFLDTLTNWAGMATQPLFESASAGLGQMNEKLTAISPAINALFSTLAAGDVEGSVQNIVTALNLLGAPPGFVEFVQSVIPQAVQQWNEFKAQLGETNAIERIGSAIDRIVVAFGGVPTPAGAASTASNEFGSALDAIVGTVDMVASGLEAVAWGVEKTNEAVQIAIGLWDQLGQIAENMNVDALAAAFERGATAMSSGISQTTVDGWNGISGAISSATAELGNFATAAVGIEMPPYLIPHSPPPLQTGFEGITSAAKKMNDAMGLDGGGQGGFAPMVERIGNIGKINFSNYNKWSPEDKLRALEMKGVGDGIAEDGSRVGPGYYRDSEVERLKQHIASQQEYRQRWSQEMAARQQAARPNPASAGPAAAAVDMTPVIAAINQLSNKMDSLGNKPTQVTVQLDRAVIAKAVSENVAYSANGLKRLGAAGKGL